MGAYLIASDEGQFDLVVAAETLQYIGPLGDIFTGTLKVLKPGGYFAFTVDRRKYADTEEEEKEVESERESRPKDQVRTNRMAPQQQQLRMPDVPCPVCLAPVQRVYAVKAMFSTCQQHSIDIVPTENPNYTPLDHASWSLGSWHCFIMSPSAGLTREHI